MDPPHRVLQGVFRHYATLALQSDPVVQLPQLKHTQLLRRSHRLRANHALLPPSGFLARRAYLAHTALDVAAAAAEAEAAEDADDPVALALLTAPGAQAAGGDGDDGADGGGAGPMDPMAMMDGMKQNLLMIVPNMLLMGWVSYFFAGFVLVKLPFPLSDRFKGMLQRGIAIRNLDASYVSSLSWYFLNMFGLRGVYALLLGTDANTGGEDQFVQQMAGGGAAAAGALGGAPDHTATYKAEKNEVEILQHDWSAIRDAQFRILGLKPPAAAAAGGKKAA